MKKSKLIALLLAMAMLVVLCACGIRCSTGQCRQHECVYRIGTGYH